MSNTKLRVISAFVMLAVLIGVITMGSKASIILVGVIGLLVIDEIVVNFLNKKRAALGYLSAQAIFMGLYYFFNEVEVSIHYFEGFNYLAGLINVSLLYYLFITKFESKAIVNTLEKLPQLTAIIIFLPLMSLAAIIHERNWINLLMSIIILNFSVDTAAWFWGKNFGKHKLWPKVSPKKTIEGFVGGVLTALVISSIYWHFAVSSLNIEVLTSLLALGCCAQLGDLVQSKLKRQFDIKDSSNLIPGHGGMYDRVDSLLFVVPFYVFVLFNVLR